MNSVSYIFLSCFATILAIILCLLIYYDTIPYLPIARIVDQLEIASLKHHFFHLQEGEIEIERDRKRERKREGFLNVTATAIKITVTEETAYSD